MSRGAIGGLVRVAMAWLGLATAVAAGAESDLSLAKAGQRLAAALERRYDCDLRALVRLELDSRSGGTRVRLIETVSKRRGGRMHALGRVLAPEHLRGMAVLTIEAHGRADDAFLHLPALGRTRRVTGSRTSEAFLGSDLTFADLERHRVEDYSVQGSEDVRVEGEPATRVRTRRLQSGSFPGVDFVVADSDLAILEIAYRDRDGRPVRRVVAPRSGIRRFGEHRIPSRLRARDPRRGSETRVFVTRLEFDPEIDDRLFSVVTLESGRSFLKR